MLKILPSIASADPLDLRSELARLRTANQIHIDIEDGNFIDNITFGLKTVAAIVREFAGLSDVHLMVSRPEDYLRPLAELGVSAVCGHIEALPYPMRFLQHAHSLGMKAGLAFNLKTCPEEFLPYTGALDYILVMTSEPDFRKQDLFPGACQRIAHFRRLVPPSVQLWCDGGIQPEHLKPLQASGMDTAVMGRALFSNGNPAALLSLCERSLA